ncbi:MAG: PAS domain-containing protein [Oscillospiraceae bacterium]|nr:PAS domain-containing protein [Oscillospiraceae bacterium]
MTNAMQNAQMQQELLDHLPCGAAIYRVNGDKLSAVYLNKRYYELVGRDDAQIRRENAAEAIYPDDVQEMVSELRASIREGRDGICELRILTGDGGYACFRVIGHAVTDEKGAQAYYCLYFPMEDGELQAVRERQKTESRYRDIAENSGGGLTITEIKENAAPTNIFTSEGMLRLMRMTRQQWNSVAGKDIYAKVFPADRDIARSIFDKIRKNGESASATYRLMCGDGKYSWVNVTGRCIVENGETHIYAVHMDISAQKQIEEKERNMSEQLAFLNRIAGDMLLGVSAEAAIHVVLQDILEHFAGRRSYVFEFDTEKQLAHNTYEVCAEGVEPAIELLEAVPFAAFAEWFVLFERDSYVAISDTASLGPDRAMERALLEAQNISALVAVPLIENGKIVGMMGVDDPEKNSEQMEHLRVIGDYMSVMLLRRNMLKELSDSNSRMEIMMSDTPGGFAQMLIRANDSIVPSYFNDGFCHMLGMTRQEVHALFDADAYAGVHPDDSSRVREQLAKTIRENGTRITQMRFRTASGEYIPVEVYYRVWEKAHGEIYLNGYYRDISEKVKLEEEYKKNLAYRELAGENMLASFRLNVTRNALSDCISDEPSILALARDGTLSGFLESSAALHSDAEQKDFVSAFSRDALLDAMARGEHRIDFKHTFIPSPDRLMWICTSVNLFRNPENNDIEGFIYAQDLTEEHMLDRLMTTVVNVDYDFIVSIDLHTGVYRTFLSNKGIITAFHGSNVYDDKAIDAILEIVHPDDRERVGAAYQLPALQKALEESGSIELRYRVIKDDEVLNKKCSVVYLDGTHSHIILSRTDETSTVREMQKAVDAAKEANAAKSIFLSHMSHEIRTPMNAILGMTQLTLDETREPETRKGLESIRNSSEYLLNIINDILDMSRIESGSFKLSCGWTTISDVMRPCLDMIKPAMEKKNIRFEYPSFEALNGYEIFVDVLKTRQMIMNLLNNACKFTGEGGAVKLFCRNLRHDESTAADLIIVEDTGCGMSEAFLKEIFSSFAQERNIYTGSVQGTGLGLALTRQIALAMGGDIAVESQLGVGSKFTLTLPYIYRLRQSGGESARKIIPDRRSNLSGLHILLCEDNMLNATIATRLLQKAGVITDHAMNGEIGVAMFAASAPGFYDAILMDIRMPEMDGLEAAKAIRALDRADAGMIPIIAMSANAFEEDVCASLEAGMNAHLAKPVEPQLLYDTLIKQIKKSKG